MRIEIKQDSGLWELVRPLYDEVWPPEVATSWAGKDLVWAHAEYRVLLREAGEALIAHVGLYPRDIRIDGVKTRVCGIGGVIVHPARRGAGYGAAAMRHAQDFMRQEGFAFALLFCEEKNVEFYRKLGWRVFAGTVIVEQPRGRGAFTILAAMVLDLNAAAPSTGTIDLCGLPW